MRAAHIEQEFPTLRSEPYEVTSPQTPSYNCIAWAAGDSQRLWWPVQHPFAYWPPSVPRSEEIEAFVEAFESLGYEMCVAGKLEAGWEKVALFVGMDGKPTHAARQLPDGRWTSKLGQLEDITHTIEGVEGRCYGRARKFLKRRVGIDHSAVVVKPPFATSGADRPSDGNPLLRLLRDLAEWVRRSAGPRS